MELKDFKLGDIVKINDKDIYQIVANYDTVEYVQKYYFLSPGGFIIGKDDCGCESIEKLLSVAMNNDLFCTVGRRVELASEAEWTRHVKEYWEHIFALAKQLKAYR